MIGFIYDNDDDDDEYYYDDESDEEEYWDDEGFIVELDHGVWLFVYIQLDWSW